MDCDIFKDLYLKALTCQESHDEDTTTHLLSGAKPIDNSLFERTLASLNIDYLHTTLIDFSKNEALLMALNDLKRRIDQHKFQAYDLTGHIAPIGSCRDGSKVAEVNELDTLYIMDRAIRPEKVPGKKNCYRVWTKDDKEIKPSSVIDQFADEIEKIVQDWPQITQESPTQHGGYATPRFSGVRFNGPATTALFTYKYPEREEAVDISMDITLAFKLPFNSPELESIDERMSRVQTEIKEKILNKDGVHLVPDLKNDAWMLTTAQLEAELLHDLSRRTALKMAFSVCKIIGQDINISDVVDKSEYRVEQMMERWTNTTEDQKLLAVTEECNELNRIMRYGHSFLSKAVAQKHHESPKSDASINSTAIKHHILAQGFQSPQLFSETANIEDDVYKIVVNTLDHLRDAKVSNIPNAFIDEIKIDILSYSKPTILSGQAKFMARNINEKCVQVFEKVVPSNTATNLEMSSDPSIGSVKYLESYLVPVKELTYPEYRYKVCVDPSVTPKRDPKVVHIKQIVNALQNSSGGSVIVTYNSTVFNHRLIDHWKDKFKIEFQTKSIINDNSDFEEAPRHKQDGEVVLYALKVSGSPERVPFDQHSTTATLYAVEDPGFIQQNNVCVGAESFKRKRNFQHTASRYGQRKQRYDIREQSDTLDIGLDFTEGESDLQQLKSVSTCDESNVDMRKSNTQAYTNEYMIGSAFYRDVEAKQQHIQEIRHGTKSRNMQLKLEPTDKFKKGSTTSFKRGRPQSRTQDSQIDKSFACENLEIFQMQSPIHFTPNEKVVLRKFPHSQDVFDHMEENYKNKSAFAIVFEKIGTSFENDMTKGSFGSDMINLTHHEFDILLVQIVNPSECSIFMYLHSVHSENNPTTRKLQMSYLFHTTRILQKALTECLFSAKQQACININPVLHSQGEVCLGFGTPPTQIEVRQSSVSISALTDALASLFLEVETYIRDAIGNDLSIWLTAQQMEKIHDIGFEPFHIVHGPPGSGKTLLGQHLCHKLGSDKCVMLCANECVAQRVRYKKNIRAFSVKDAEALHEQVTTTFKESHYIIVDDAQYIDGDKDTWSHIFGTIQSTQRKMILFMDSKYQTLKGDSNVKNINAAIADHMDECLKSELTEIHRNTQTVVEYMDVATSTMKKKEPFQCMSPEIGDDIKVTHVLSYSRTFKYNGLLLLAEQIGKHESLDAKYAPNDIAILFDSQSTTTSDDIVTIITEVFKRYWPESSPQRATKFPVTGIIIDKFKNFLGLEAKVVLFVIDGADGDINEPTYINAIASRAIERVEFVTEHDVHVSTITDLHFNKEAADPEDIRRNGYQTQ